MRRIPYLILGLSIFLSLLAVMAYNPVTDDVLILQYAITGRDLGYALVGPSHISMHFHVPGFLSLLRLLYSWFGPSLVLFRLTFMSFGLAAIALLAWTVRRSPLAVLSLAGLLWTPIFFAHFREIRYDTFNLLMVAITVAWYREGSRPWIGFWVGLLNGLAPLFAVHGVFLIVAMTITLLMVSREPRYLPYLLGLVIGVCVTMHAYPVDPFMEELIRSQLTIASHQTAGMALLMHPWELIRRFCFMTFRPFHGLFDITTYILYPVLFIALLLNWRNRSAFFTLVYLVIHAIFSASIYPVIINPLMVAIGIEFLDA